MAWCVFLGFTENADNVDIDNIEYRIYIHTMVMLYRYYYIALLELRVCLLAGHHKLNKVSLRRP